MRLHGIGYAQLENEREVEAESTYRELIDLVPDEPLGHANLAVALLRQDRKDEALAAIDRALELGGHRADLLLIRADILQWSGRNQDALVDYRRASRAAPDDPETQYALFRLAEIMDGAQAEADRRDAVERLRGLRPDNLVVLLLSGEAALEDGDRGRASDDYLRVRELIWQAQPVAERVVEEVLDALEADDLESARRMAPRVTNVMKGTAGWRSSQPEVFTNVQGIPVERFVDESPIEDFGPALPVRFRATRIDNSAAAGRALEVADFDGDDRPDIAWVAAGDGSETPPSQLQLRRASAGLAAPGTAPETDARLLVVGDADNDRRLDLVAAGDPLAVWQVDATAEIPRFADASDRFLAQPFAASAADLIDFDSDGDLDLAVARTGGGPDLLRNVSGEGAFEGPLEALGSRALPEVEPRRFHHLQATDADRDGDTDLLLAHDAGVLWLDNLRQGRFAERTPPAPAGSLLGRLVGRLLGDDAEPALATGTPVRVVRTADLDRDGIPEFVLAGASTVILRAAENGALAPFPLTAESVGLPEGATELALLDADNDGRRDLALVAGGELRVLTQTSDSGPEALEFQLAQVTGLPRDAGFTAVRADDLDGDGDQDLVAAGASGLYRIENLNGSENNWLRVRLVGLAIGNQKNNVFGRGTTIEVKSERAYQYIEVDRPVTHIGLGNRRRPDLVRVVWANGVPQNRLDPGENMTIVEEQVLKGSCPFLYTWDGEKVSFVTDLLWGAPLGMPLADGVWNGYDPDELVRVDGARTRDGFYDLRITEELWEAAYIDRVRLWVVDHREGVEVASNLRIVPGRGHVGRPPDEVVAGANIRPRGPGHGRPRPRRDGARPGPRRGLRRRLPALALPGPRRRALDVHLRPRRSARQAGPAVAGRLGVPRRCEPEPRHRPGGGARRPGDGDDPARGRDRGRLADPARSDGLPARQDEDDGRRHPAAARGRAEAPDRDHPLAALGPDRLEHRTGRRRRRRCRRPGPSERGERRPLVPRLLGADPARAQRPAPVRLPAHERRVSLAALPRPLHPLRRRPRVARRRRRPPGRDRPRRRDPRPLRRPGAAAARARLHPHRVPRELRLGQGRRPQHLEGGQQPAAALPGDVRLPVRAGRELSADTGTRRLPRAMADEDRRPGNAVQPGFLEPLGDHAVLLGARVF